MSDRSLERGRSYARVPTARFDNLRDFTTTTLDGFERALRADVLDEVIDVLSRAEHAAQRGQWVAGYVSYEAAAALDPSLPVHARDRERAGRVPLAWFGIFRTGTTRPLVLPRYRRVTSSPWTSRIREDDYVKKVQSILDEIEIGSAYQVNLTTTLLHDGVIDPEALYRQLVVAQQPAYGSLFTFDDVAIVSASPELFFEWDGARLRTRPMKGTTRRGRFPAEDEARAAVLMSSNKESAENVMIVDLIRNDMGKVAEIGTVVATELRSLEAYPNVWQLVSEVQCRTRPDVTLLDIFRAMFPCGSVTGAPKQSAMEIIQRLEESERGVYCGAVGLLRPEREGMRARFSVAIRTAVVAGNAAHYGSGGGVVAESDPTCEYHEMVLKAEMLAAAPTRPFRLLETFGDGPGVSRDTVRAHVDRMRSSARFFGFRYPEDLEERVISGLGSETPARIRLLLSRSGYLEVQRGESPAPRRGPVRLVIDDEPVSSESVMLFHKTTSRRPYDRRRRAHPRADDVVMINERGECTETTIATIAMRRGERWFTPPLASGCLPGIERARLIREGVLTEAVVRPEDLSSADELAVLNSLRGWQRATLSADDETSGGGVESVSLAPRAQI
jgi:para-aminobenzoate synthetase/4-amino-4-deoxychorismate lyase